MARIKFNFPNVVVGKGMVEVSRSPRLYCTITLVGVGYKTAVVKVFPKVKDFTWAQLTSATATREWKRVGNHLVMVMSSTIFCDQDYHFKMVELEGIIMNSGLSIYVESTKF